MKKGGTGKRKKEKFWCLSKENGFPSIRRKRFNAFFNNEEKGKGGDFERSSIFERRGEGVVLQNKEGRPFSFRKKTNQGRGRRDVNFSLKPRRPRRVATSLEALARGRGAIPLRSRGSSVGREIWSYEGRGGFFSCNGRGGGDFSGGVTRSGCFSGGTNCGPIHYSGGKIELRIKDNHCERVEGITLCGESSVGARGRGNKPTWVRLVTRERTLMVSGGKAFITSGGKRQKKGGKPAYRKGK